MLIQNGTLLLQRYRIIEALGEGGFAKVFHAIDMQLNRDVAIKVIKITASDDSVPRLQREAKILGTLSHKNIMAVYSFDFIDDFTPIVVCEYLSGMNLRAYLNQVGKLGYDQLLPLLKQVLAGLSYVHKAGVIHRDLSPVNMLLVNDGSESVVKLLDFGLSKVFDSANDKRLTTTGELMGNPPYMSPEQVRGADTDARSDIYALGCILYECVTGAQAFYADTALGILSQQQAFYPAKPALNWPNAERQKLIENIMLRCLQKDPKKRFQSCQEIEALLTADSSATSVVAPVGEALEPWSDAASSTKKSSLNLKLLIPLALLLLLVLLFSSNFFLSYIATTLADPSIKMPAMQLSFAEILRNAHRYELSLGLYESAAKQFEATRQEVNAADCHIASADFLLRLHKNHRALEHIYAALRCTQSVDDKDQAKVLLRRIWKSIEPGYVILNQPEDLLAPQMEAFQQMLALAAFDKAELRSLFGAMNKHVASYATVSKEDLKSMCELTLAYLKTSPKLSDQGEQLRLDELTMCAQETQRDLAEKLWKIRLGSQRGLVQPHEITVRKVRLAWCMMKVKPDESLQIVNEILSNEYAKPKVKSHAYQLKAEIEFKRKQFDSALADVDRAIVAGPAVAFYVILLTRKIELLYYLHRTKDVEAFTKILVATGGVMPEDTGPRDYLDNWGDRLKPPGTSIFAGYHWADTIGCLYTTNQIALCKDVCQRFLAQSNHNILVRDRGPLHRIVEADKDPELVTLVEKVLAVAQPPDQN